LSKSS